MIVSRPHPRWIFCTLQLTALAAILAAGFALPARAQGTHLWTQSRLDEFEKGTPQGVALTSDGRLRAGPGLTEVAATPSTYVWSVTVDKGGTAYVGTGSPAAVLRMGARAGEKAFTLFETRDLAVEVVRVGPDGALYAATAPSGKVYRLKADASGKQDDQSAAVVFDMGKLDDGKAALVKAGEAEKTGSGKTGAGKTGDGKADAGSHYIWDLTFDAAGRLYVATGGPGAVYRVDVGKAGEKPEVFFKTDEQHIRCLAWDGKGNLIAGTDGSGLVYRISEQGKGYVLFEAPRREIAAVAVSEDGTIYAASMGDKSHNPLPPLPVQGSGSGSVTIISPPSLLAANTSSTLPEGTEIYALSAGAEGLTQAPRKIWAGKDEIVYALAARADGLLAVTGNQGRVFRIAADGSYADIAHVDAQQGLSLAVVGDGTGGVLIGTGNTGKLVRLGAAEKHEYASDVLDAGALARFGHVEVEPGSEGFEIRTRSGNVEQPVRGRNDWGWSDWQPLKDGAVASPAGRYLQWKAVLHADGQVAGVGVNYLPVNAAPVVDDVVVAPGARWTAQPAAAGQAATVNIQFASQSQSGASFDAGANAALAAVKDRGAITVRWAAHDDNGDDLTYALYLKGDGESVWRLLKDQILEKAYSFDATLIPDGGYQVKVVASDAPSHTPGQALTGTKVSERFEVDTTPPVVSALKATAEAGDCKGSPCQQPFKVSVDVSFEAEDGFSAIAHAEYSLDAGPWQYVEPVGGLSDSRREHYELHVSLNGLAGKTSEHLITVRVYDRHENVGVAKTVIAAEEK